MHKTLNTQNQPMDNNIYEQIDALTQRILSGGEMSVAEGQWMIRLHEDYLPWLMAGADRIRKTFRGNDIEVCAISNVRSGNCSENCSFCSQSGHYQTNSPVYNYISSEQLGEQAQRARQWGASDFGVVSLEIKDDSIDTIDLEATDGQTYDNDAAPQYLVISSHKYHYVFKNNDDPAYPYDSPEKAATNIWQAGLVASRGDIVLIIDFRMRSILPI